MSRHGRKGRIMNIAIITGASSGIGMEFARQMDEGLHRIGEFWLIARRRDRLEELAEKLSHRARVLVLDLTDGEDVNRFRRLLERERPVIRMLVNCSGYGVMGIFADLELEEQVGMIDLNCRALTEMTHLCIPYMRKKSRIIQIASSAAFLPQPGFAVYAASKAYVLSFSRALAGELSEAGILVTAVCPGPVRTPFFDRAERGGSTLAIKKYVMAEAEDVVRDALRASGRGRTVCVYGPAICAFRLLCKAVPQGWILAVMRKLK